MRLYRMDFLQILATHFGRYLGTDNATINRARAMGARICVEVDLSTEPVKGFSIVLSPKQCIWQEAKYEKLEFFCSKCCRQGHTAVVCRMGDKRKEDGNHKEKKVWKPKYKDGTLAIDTKMDKGEKPVDWEAGPSNVQMKKKVQDLCPMLTKIPLDKDNGKYVMEKSAGPQRSKEKNVEDYLTESDEEDCEEVWSDEDNRGPTGELMSKKLIGVDSLN